MKLLYKHTEHQSFSQDATKNATHSLTLKSPAMTPSLKSPNFIRTKDRHRITYVLAR